MNADFPARDMFTLFVDGCAVADLTGDAHSEFPLLTSLAQLKPTAIDEPSRPTLDPGIARTVVAAVSASR